MPDFTVKISTPADLEGAKALEQALAVARDKAEALGQSTADLDAQLAKVRASIAGAGEASGKAAGETQKLGLHHHQLHEVLQQVAPGLAQMASFLTTGFAGAIGVALVAFTFLTDKLDEFKKYLEAISTGPGARGEWAEKIADNTREAAVEMAGFNEKLREAAAAQENLDTITDRLVEHQKAQADAAKQVGDAQKQLDLARLQLAEKLGQVTPDQAVKIRLEIDDAAFKRQLAAETAGIQAELTARQQQYQQNENRQPDLQRNVERTAQAALNAQNARDKNAGKLDQDKKDLADLRQIQDRLQSGLQLNDIIPQFAQKFAARGSMVDLAQAGPDQISNLIAGKQRVIGQESGKQTGLETTAAVAKQQSDLAQSTYEAAAKMETDVVNTITDLQAKLASAQAKNKVLSDIHAQTTAVQAAASNPSDLIAQHGASLTGDVSTAASNAASAISQAGAAVRAGHGDAQQLHALLNQVIGLASDIHAGAAQRVDLNSLRVEVENLASQIHHNRNGGPGS